MYEKKGHKKEKQRKKNPCLLLSHGKQSRMKETGWLLTAMDHSTHHHAWIYVIVDRRRRRRRRTTKHNVAERINVNVGGAQKIKKANKFY